MLYFHSLNSQTHQGNDFWSPFAILHILIQRERRKFAFSLQQLGFFMGKKFLLRISILLTSTEICMTFSRLGESYWHLCTMTDLFLGPCCGHSLPNKSGLEIFHYMFHKYNIYNIFHKYFNPFSPLRRMEWTTLVVDKDKRFKFFKLSASFSKVTGESTWLCFVLILEHDSTQMWIECLAKLLYLSASKRL